MAIVLVGAAPLFAYQTLAQNAVRAADAILPIAVHSGPVRSAAGVVDCRRCCLSMAPSAPL